MNCADAPRLLQERREAAKREDFDRIKEIDRIRWEHEEQNNYCKCWQNARREAAKAAA